MNSAVLRSAVVAFLNRTGNFSKSLADRVSILENPTEEVAYAQKNRKFVKLFANGVPGARGRLEENYLFDTRRFPSWVDGETFAAALAPAEYVYFMNAIGGNSANNGFSPAIGPMSEIETNMDTPGQVPQGKNFVMTQVGISFNADITAANASTMLEAGSLRFSKQGGQFVMHQGTPKMWGGGMGFPQSNAGTFASNGNPDIRAVRRLAVPRVLEQRSQFRYTYFVPRASRNTVTTASAMTLGAAVIMTIWLWGGQEDSIPT